MNSPYTWSSDNDYIAGQQKVTGLKVVNDVAEQQAFSGVLTSHEEQIWFLLQVVEKHCRDFPNFLKSTFTSTSADS